MQAMADASLTSLINASIINAPLELERDYKGTHLTAVIEETGKVVFAGDTYDSLSTAACMARKLVIVAQPDRPYPQTNGWVFWQDRDDSGELQEVEELRKRYLWRADGATT